MGLDHERAAVAVGPAAVRPLLARAPPARRPRPERASDRDAVRAELAALLRVHEPARSAAHADRLLDAFPEAERELLAAYRQFYAPADRLGGGVRAHLATAAGHSRAPPPPPLQLPRAALPTFLRAKRAPGGKADDVRAPSAVKAEATGAAIDLSATVGGDGGLRPARRPARS